MLQLLNQPTAEKILGKEDLIRIYTEMLRLRILDQRMLTLQRQGRVGFYGTATGEEAAIIGSAFALSKDDWIFPALDGRRCTFAWISAYRIHLPMHGECG